MSSSTVFLKVNRVSESTCKDALRASVSDLHEAMGSAGRAALMSPRMKPVWRGARCAGPAVTACCAPGDNLMMHRALYLAQPGDVLVVVCRDEASGAQWGDVAAQYARTKGIAGVVVHGCTRDTDALEAMKFPVWSTLIHSMHPDKQGHGTVNAPVVCAGVHVRPGDLIVADGDGVLAISRELAAETVALGLERMSKEEGVAVHLRAGKSVWELSGAAASYAKLGVREFDRAFDDPA